MRNVRRRCQVRRASRGPHAVFGLAGAAAPGAHDPAAHVADGIAGDLIATGSQAFHPERRRRRLLNHDDRGFLLISKSVAGPRIAGPAPGTRRHTYDTVSHAYQAGPACGTQ